MTSVLRLGHRPERDKRMTTHVGLTARALGADEIYIPGTDERVKNTLEDVTERFGGRFKVKKVKDWRDLIKSWDGDVVHLTMYGIDIENFFDENRVQRPLIIVGAEKVPGDVYDLADHNVAVGDQPHSEVAALAVFLDRLNDRNIPHISDGEMGVLPTRGGKRVIDYSKVPSLAECYSFLKEKGADPDLIEHTMGVLDRTLELQRKYGGDMRLLAAGAMLHDVGRTITHDERHGIEGGRLVREKGWHEELARIVERHIGGGVTKEEAEEQGLPSKSYLPETLEEKIICHADNTVGGKKRFEGLLKRTEEAGFKNSADRMRRLVEEFGL